MVGMEEERPRLPVPHPKKAGGKHEEVTDGSEILRLKLPNVLVPRPSVEGRKLLNSISPREGKLGHNGSTV
jgi:hypothetical protein